MTDVGTDGVLGGPGPNLAEQGEGWENVDSRRFKAMKYNPAESRLSIRWKDGSIGHYEEVPPEEYEALRAADSLGIHLGQHIIPRFKYTKG